MQKHAVYFSPSPSFKCQNGGRVVRVCLDESCADLNQSIHVFCTFSGYSKNIYTLRPLSTRGISYCGNPVGAKTTWTFLKYFISKWKLLAASLFPLVLLKCNLTKRVAFDLTTYDRNTW